MFRTESQFTEALRRGLQIEEDFAAYVAKIGGHATAFGPPPIRKLETGDERPLTCHLGAKGDTAFFPSPDLLIEFPFVSAKVQIKGKRIQQEGTADAHFILDTVEKERMETANAVGVPTLFVVYCPGLCFYPGLAPYSFIDVADLAPEITKLRLRQIKGKSAFVLPVRLFRSFDLANLKALEKPHADNKPTENHQRHRRTEADPRNAGSPRREDDARSSGSRSASIYASAEG